MKKPNKTRSLSVRVKTAKGRKISSTLWLNRQLNDPYVTMARKEGYRSRAIYKFIQIDEKFKFLQPQKKLLDLGAAPGGWSQWAVRKLGKSNVMAIDISDMEPIDGCLILKQDIYAENTLELIQAWQPMVDIVVSDMAASSSGHTDTDHIRIVNLCRAAYEMAVKVLNIDGVFVAKILKGGTEDSLLKEIKNSFKVVKHFKPDASRAGSAESYIIAMGFKGNE